jgi:hypothetical protein
MVRVSVTSFNDLLSPNYVGIPRTILTAVREVFSFRPFGCCNARPLFDSVAAALSTTWFILHRSLCQIEI